MEKSSKILVTGGDGVVGSYMKIGLRLSHVDLDVTNLPQVRKVLKHERPKTVIHLAAITDMKQCENDPNLALGVNAVGARNVALASKEVGAKVIYISTNAVFDGKKKGAYKPGDKSTPINVYGRSKYEGELAILQTDHKNLVVRTSWVFGGGKDKDRKFVGKIMPKLLSDEDLSAVSDVHGTPTYGKDLALALEKLATSDISGVVHVTNAGKASRYDMASVVRKTLGSRSRISKVTLSGFGQTANTLKNEVLEAGEHVLRPWREALAEYIETEWK